MRLLHVCLLFSDSLSHFAGKRKKQKTKRGGGRGILPPLSPFFPFHAPFPFFRVFFPLSPLFFHFIFDTNFPSLWKPEQSERRRGRRGGRGWEQLKERGAALQKMSNGRESTPTKGLNAPPYLLVEEVADLIHDWLFALPRNHFVAQPDTGRGKSK